MKSSREGSSSGAASGGGGACCLKGGRGPAYPRSHVRRFDAFTLHPRGGGASWCFPGQPQAASSECVTVRRPTPAVSGGVRSSVSAPSPSTPLHTGTVDEKCPVSRAAAYSTSCSTIGGSHGTKWAVPGQLAALTPGDSEFYRSLELQWSSTV